MVYELKEYNQNENSEETFTNRTFNIFYNKKKLKDFIEKNDIYGKVFEYDEEEYSDYYNDITDELPEILDEFNTTEI